MLKFLIGPALLGAGYLAGSAYGKDAEQVVHTSPSETYAAVERALGNVPSSGTTFFDGGEPIPYELKVERALDQRLVVTLFFAGRQGAQANIDFAAQNGGKDTLVTARIHGDHGVLRSALAGTNKARLAYAPDWMLNLSFRPVLQQLAAQIEAGGTARFEGMTSSDAQAQWEAGLNQEQREKVSEWQQYEATRPAVDPNADAQRFMKGASGSN
jgi:hypothetical protein